jgi:hypothetical protein
LQYLQNNKKYQQHRGKAQHGSSKESLSNKASNNDLQQHELEHLDELLRQLAEPDWKRRYESISSIGNLISTFPEAFNSTRVVKLFDIFIDRLKDSNTKVNLYALQSLNEWTKPLKV